jgi:hypothetical protein
MIFNLFRTTVDDALEIFVKGQAKLTKAVEQNNKERNELESIVVQASARMHALETENKRAERISAKIKAFVE